MPTIRLAPDVAEEEEDDHHGADDADDEGLKHVAHGIPDVLALAVDGGKAHPVHAVLFQGGQDAAADIHGGGAVLLGDAEHHGPLAVIPGDAAGVLLVKVQEGTHIGHLHGMSVGGLEAIADGDFSVRLDPSKAGPMSSTYEDFNKMGKELQSIQTLREDFINNFSHEFKTPITAVQGFAELLQEPDLTEEDRRQYTQIILNESTRLASLADSALLLTHLEAQQVIPDQAPYALDEQIKQCAILLSGQWERKHIAFSAELEEASFVGNQEVMRHVWLNLLNNAIKYTPEGGEITVTLTVSAGEIAVRVSDTGIGMDEETQRHVFDKYYQGPAGKKGQGLGLGLAIVHRIVELCGGGIEVHSVADQGSTFTVRLPEGAGKGPSCP